MGSRLSGVNMSVFGPLEVKPLACAIHALSAVTALVFSQAATAIPVIGEMTIDNRTPFQSYEVSGAGSKLTANVATTRAISVGAGAEVELNGSVVDGRGDHALTLGGAKAAMTGSNLSSDTLGLNDLGGSEITAVNSSIRGGDTGAVVGSGSTLTLQKTNVVGSYAGSVGLQLQGGTVRATNESVIRGGQAGVVMTASAAGDTHSLTLDNSSVEGETGAAIVVGRGGAVSANISVLNGSNLIAGNGTLLEVNSGSAASLRVDNSHLAGDVIVEAGSTASLVLDNQATLIGRLDNVSSLALNRGAQWTLVENSQLGDVSMDGGAIKFGEPGAFYTLSVASLEGNGTFVMDADFTLGKTDVLEVTGLASGDHRLMIGSSGTDPLADSKLSVVTTGGGDAEFSLATGRVDLGAYSYDLIREGNEWFLASKGTISPGTRSVLGLFNAAPTVWYGEMSTLGSRMGDIRMNPGNAGFWMRGYGNKFNVAGRSGFAYTQQQQGLSVGADAPLPYGNARWLVGVMGGYSQSDLDLQQGTTGKVDSYYLGAYVTWADDSGFYVDSVVKLNRFQNESSVGMSDGSITKGAYASHGLGATVEAGQHIKLANDYYVEPYAQVAALVVQGSDYTLGNGMKAEGDQTHSVLGKLGVTAGRHFDLGDDRLIKPYVRAAWAQEFASRNKVEVNGNAFNNDLSGARAEFGVGVAMTMTDRVSLHADVEYSHAEKIQQPYGVNAGVRYSW